MFESKPKVEPIKIDQVNEVKATVANIIYRLKKAEEYDFEIANQIEDRDNRLNQNEKNINYQVKTIHNEILGIKKEITSIKNRLHGFLKLLKIKAKKTDITFITDKVMEWDFPTYITQEEFSRMVKNSKN